ncbi:hypothetical protein [Streptomyces phage phiScoe10]|nr:hypothetical protein [Streptomyces phage phiScoe10]
MGNYPFATSHRMALDVDGTQTVFINTSNVVTAVSAAEAVKLNAEDDSIVWRSLGAGADRLVHVFPEPRDIDGIFLNSGGSNSYDGVALGTTIDISTNTTNGLDGTWTNAVPYTNRPGATATVPAYRTQYQPLPAAGVKGIRVSFAKTTGYSEFQVRAFFVYGSIAAGQNPDRLAVWHGSLDERVSPAYFDFEESARNSQKALTFRVKNLSPTKTSNGTTVNVETLSDANPTLIGQFAVSLDGNTYSTSVNVGNVAPGATSAPVYIRCKPSVNAALGLWALRLKAAATSWS